jgi:hypothetical protein
MAIAKIIAFLAPGAVPDIEVNRKYLAEMTAKMRMLTGMNLEGYDAWKTWFDANGPSLRWSDGENRLVVAKDAP